MKKLVIFILVLVVLAGGAVIALPKLVPMDKIRTEVSARFKEATGRNISFADPSVVVWPNIGVRLADVKISNPSWAKNDNMITLGEMDVSLALMPLFDHKVEVKRFYLKSPSIALETSADGKNSWTFDIAQPTAGESKAGSGASSPSMQDFEFHLGEFKIEDGKVLYRDGKTGQTSLIDDVDMTIGLPDLKSALDLDGALTYNKKRVNLSLKLEKPLDFTAGKASKGSLEVKSDDISANVSGMLATSGTMLKGKIDADISSLQGLVAWVTGAAAGDMPFKKISFKSDAEATAGKLKLSGAALGLDDLNAGGDVTVNYGGAKPDIYARVAIDKIDLDRFMPADAPAGSGAGEKKTASSGSQDWDDTPMDFSGLKAVNADLVMQTKGFSLKGADVGPSSLVVLLKDGNLSFKSSEASLFDGKFSSSFDLGAATATPTMAFDFSMNGVQAKPVLKTFADFEKLSGAADAKVSVKSSGRSQRAMIHALNGNGSVMFRDGALEGIDLVNIAKMIQSKLDGMGVGEGKTDFVELGGAFKITNGIAHNDDLKMKGPLVQTSGSGDIDLPKKYVQYRVVPVLTASSAVDNASGLKVPVDIKGPFSNIKVKPDYAAAIKGVLDNPEDIKATIKGAKEQLKPLKENFKDIKKDPSKALNSILNGGGLGGLFGQPKAAPVEAAPAETPAPETATEPATVP